MNRILRAASVGFVAFVTTAACGRVDYVGPRGVAGGYANEAGVAVGAGVAPSAGASLLDAGPSPSAGASLLGCPAAGDAEATVADNVVALSLGAGFTCALTASGAVQCSGSDPSGGSGYQGVVPGLESGVTAISAGTEAACALTTNGAVQCWGRPPVASSACPETVPGLESGVVAISVACCEFGSSACAITASGAVQCWGDNTYGQLGNGSSGLSSSGAVVSYPSETVPMSVAGLDNGVTAVSVGGLDACAVTAGGAVQCWGDNTYGQLGIDPMALAFSAVPVTVPRLTSGVTAVSVGDGAACALNAGGQVACWGSAWGFVSDVAGPWGPVPVAGLSGGVTAVSVTRNDGCALTADAGVMCWGDDFSLGNVYPPMTVAGLESGATAIAVQAGEACAVTGSGGVECWVDPATPAILACGYENGDAGGNSPNSADSSITGCADPLTFADPYIETLVRGGPSGPIHPADVCGIGELDLSPAANPLPDSGPGTSLAGLECLPNLTVLSLSYAVVTNVPRLPQVREFSGQDDSNMADILSALPSLRVLRLVGGDLSSAEARAGLSAMTGLTTLSVPGAGLTDTAPLGALSLLTDVDIRSNRIQDISSLSALANLRSLDLSVNSVTDLSPLVANVSLGYGTGIDMRDNPIDCTAQAQNIATLRARGVTLTTDCL